MTRTNVIILLLIILVTAIAAGSTALFHQTSKQQSAQTWHPVTLPNTEIRLLSSAHVRQSYKLYISLPPDYQTQKKHYPVVYLLDADYSFALAKNITDHIIERNQMPPLILVGIAYDGALQYRLNRTRDYTPTHTMTGGYGPEYQKYSGGGPRFREFIRSELIPFIARNYRTTEERTLVGHSYGGLFGAWTALTSPELFSNYLLISPSLWYDNYLMFGSEKEFADHHTSLPIRMFLAVGSREISEERNMIADLRRFREQITARSYQNLSLEMIVCDDETHNSVFPGALTKGLRFIYPHN